MKHKITNTRDSKRPIFIELYVDIINDVTKGRINPAFITKTVRDKIIMRIFTRMNGSSATEAIASFARGCPITLYQ